jgi:hypothetical protein
MSATSAPFGFVPVRHPTGESRGMAYTIASGYATQINKYQPVILSALGQVIVGAAALDLLGVFAGCEYTDITGKRVVSNFWPAGVVATNIVCWIWDDPFTVFQVQGDGPIPISAIGNQADVTNVAAVGAGFSYSTLSSALSGVGSQGQFRIMQMDTSIDNTAGDAYTKVLVSIARHQYVANKVAV